MSERKSYSTTAMEHEERLNSLASGDVSGGLLAELDEFVAADENWGRWLKQQREEHMFNQEQPKEE